MLDKLRQANEDRAKIWPGAVDLPMLFKAVELAGEAGELCNAVKKLYRADNDVAGNKETREEIFANLVEELADVVICVDLLAAKLDIDLTEAVKAKFNKTSNKVGLPTKL